jgi:hypothetical protein
MPCQTLRDILIHTTTLYYNYKTVTNDNFVIFPYLLAFFTEILTHKPRFPERKNIFHFWWFKAHFHLRKISTNKKFSENIIVKSWEFFSDGKFVSALGICVIILSVLTRNLGFDFRLGHFFCEWFDSIWKHTRSRKLSLRNLLSDQPCVIALQNNNCW